MYLMKDCHKKELCLILKLNTAKKYDNITFYLHMIHFIKVTSFLLNQLEPVKYDIIFYLNASNVKHFLHVHYKLQK